MARKLLVPVDISLWHLFFFPHAFRLMRNKEDIIVDKICHLSIKESYLSGREKKKLVTPLERLFFVFFFFKKEKKIRRQFSSHLSESIRRGVKLIPFLRVFWGIKLWLIQILPVLRPPIFSGSNQKTNFNLWYKFGRNLHVVSSLINEAVAKCQKAIPSKLNSIMQPGLSKRRKLFWAKFTAKTEVSFAGKLKWVVSAEEAKTKCEPREQSWYPSKVLVSIHMDAEESKREHLLSEEYFADKFASLGHFILIVFVAMTVKVTPVHCFIYQSIQLSVATTAPMAD